MAVQGTAVVNFGSGALEASVAITGQTAFTAGTNLFEAWAACNETVGSYPDDSSWVEFMQVYAIYPITGTGFTITMKPGYGKGYGSYNVNWIWN
jgi:hypothetical protein